MSDDPGETTRSARNTSGACGWHVRGWMDRSAPTPSNEPTKSYSLHLDCHAFGAVQCIRTWQYGSRHARGQQGSHQTGSGLDRAGKGEQFRKGCHWGRGRRIHIVGDGGGVLCRCRRSGLLLLLGSSGRFVAAFSRGGWLCPPLGCDGHGCGLWTIIRTDPTRPNTIRLFPPFATHQRRTKKQ